MKFIEYISTGEIISVQSTSNPDILPAPKPGLSRAIVMEDSEINVASHYVSEGLVVERPDMPITVGPADIRADGIDVFSVSSAPTEVSVTLDGVVSDEWVESSDTIALTINVPGTYGLYLSKFPFKDVRVVFNAS